MNNNDDNNKNINENNNKELIKKLMSLTKPALCQKIVQLDEENIKIKEQLDKLSYMNNNLYGELFLRQELLKDFYNINTKNTTKNNCYDKPINKTEIKFGDAINIDNEVNNKSSDANTDTETKGITIYKKVLKKIKTLIKIFKQYGFIHTLKVTRRMLFSRSLGHKYMKRNQPSKKRRLMEQRRLFTYSPKISILVPLYNTPKEFLTDMLDSVKDQTYGNWELCLYDGSDESHDYVKEVCEGYVNLDKRIKYLKTNQGNLGISSNTNKCIEMASGDYIALLDHDDFLHPSALYDVVSVINSQEADFIYTDECAFEKNKLKPKSIHMKPDFSPDTLRSYNYICHFSVFSSKLLKKVGLFSTEHDGSQDYDMILRLTENATKVFHIPRVLYFWRIHEGSVASDVSVKPYCIASAKKAITDQLKRLGLNGTVTDSSVITTYKVNYEINGEPLISILIPNKDHIKDLNKCLTSILKKSTYKNIEIIVIENNSENTSTFDYYKKIIRNPKIKIVKWSGEFNYSLINNYASKYAKGEYLLLLNNDTEVITPNWIEEMLMFAQRPDVGAVGAKLLFNDDTVQHAGVILGINNVAGHAHKGFKRSDNGYAARLTIAQNFSAVTAACMLIRKEVFDKVGGLDKNFCVAFNDIDMCLRIRLRGYLVVFTPYAELYHYESKSRGYEDTSKEKTQRYTLECNLLAKRWGYELKNDPYYNKNLSLEREDFALK